MLVLLLEHAGELVSREQLSDRLWNDQTNVEFNNGLHVAAAKLREALDETAGRPKYFRTISGKGYQFIAQVTPVLMDAADPAAPFPNPVPTPVPPPPLEETPSLIGSRPRFSVRTILVPALLLLLICFAGATAWVVYAHLHTPVVSGSEKVLLGGFTNATGNPELEGVLTFPFQRAMQESPYLHFVSYTGLQPAAGAETASDHQKQLADCRAQQAQILLTGEVSGHTDGFTVHLYEWKCANGRLLTQQTSTASSTRDVLGAMDNAAVSLRRRMGEPEETLKRFNASVAEGTTSSLAALRAISLGYQKMSEGKSEEALQDYKMAVDLDSEFALAYARLGALAGNRGALVLARQYFTTAFRLRNRTTDRERLNIIGQYHREVTGDSRQAIETYQLWASLYPYDARPLNNEAFLYIILGQPEKAVELARKAVLLEPDNKIIYTTLAHTYQATGNFTKLNPLCKDPWLDQNDNASFHHVCFLSAFAQQDQAGMQYELRPVHGSAANLQLLEDTAWAANYHGKINDADRLFLQAETEAGNSGIEGLRADILIDHAIQEADLGIAVRAKLDADEALRQNPDSNRVRSLAALVFARAGDLSRATSLAQQAEEQSPADTIVNKGVLACVRSSIDLARNDPAAAIRSLEETRPFDFASDLFLFPAYYRGLAYESNHQLKEAAAEFQKVIDHRYVFPISPYVVLSRLELARVLALAGDIPEASQEVSTLRGIWISADPSFLPMQRLESISSPRIPRPQP